MQHLIIASTSTVHGSGYLEYILEELSNHFKNAKTIVFIPYARPGGISHNAYTEIVNTAFSKIGKTAVGLHTFKNPEEAIKNAEAIFTGGGNTFVLINQLYKNNLLEPLRNAIKSGTPYLGTSAGSNICGLTIKTTNDMPIVYPPSFNALALVPFNINPHYLDPDKNSTHMGETRETRIKEFHFYNTQPVIGLREGSWLEVKNNNVILKGPHTARIFEHGKPPYEINPETNLTHLN
ncbi:dipeptidase PepE [Jejuia pallidilutea]|uniref:dipeptidase E n=1 Tax=Jejuia pallidilutea TaxID=504487 RepID=A0A090W7N5_9FLAO|nr:dipeptidase PepE [Jejuia pallidilutea]GAL68929.1 alpha-aspartyl dipeptidase peptidase E [Jejuia pallidilutea]GAL73005.1 alpha-aspartyl dipeptidase peptidase E [Jejuia pallidilutea]GAL91052.1 alpha-aspartyl dipeptidasepeptidase E [Jejuia pallidilutea]